MKQTKLINFNETLNKLKFEQENLFVVKGIVWLSKNIIKNINFNEKLKFLGLGQDNSNS